MGLKINEEEIEKNFFENMNQAKKFIENAESSFNVLRIPADFEFYKTIINMQSDIKDNIRNVEEIYDSIHSYIEDIKNVEKNNEDLINSLSWESNSSDNNNVNEIDNKTTEVSYGSTEFELLDEDTNGYIKGLDNSISKMEDRIGEIDKRLSELEVEIQDTITHSQIEHAESNQSKNETTTMTTAEVEKEGNKKQKEEKKSTEENSTSNYEELKEKLKKEEEDLKQEKEKLNNDIQNIKTSITYMERLLKEANTLKEYYNITKSDDYKNFKVNKDRPELTEILWEEGTDGLIPINEDIYYKYNPLLIAEHICDIYEGQYAYNDSDVKMIDYYKSGSGELSKYLSWYVYMTQDQRDMYNYLYEKQGIDSADEYARKLEQTEFWNMQKGQYQAETFLESLDYEKDKDGNYVPTKDSLNKILKSFDEGASDGIDSFSEGLENLFKSNVEMTDLQYKQIIIYQYLSTINQKSYSFGQSYGNTIVPTLIGTITGTSLLGAGLMGASATGNAKQQALQKGKSLGEAWTYGIFSGLSDSALEYFLGSIPGLSNMKGLNRLIKTNSTAKTIVGKLVCNAFREGSEEYIQQWVQTGIDYVYGENIDLGEVNEQALESFCMGAGLSILNAVNMPITETMNTVVTYKMNGKKYTMTYDDIIKRCSTEDNNINSNTKLQMLKPKITKNMIQKILWNNGILKKAKGIQQAFCSFIIDKFDKNNLDINDIKNVEVVGKLYDEYIERDKTIRNMLWNNGVFKDADNQTRKSFYDFVVKKFNNNIWDIENIKDHEFIKKLCNDYYIERDSEIRRMLWNNGVFKDADDQTRGSFYDFVVEKFNNNNWNIENIKDHKFIEKLYNGYCISERMKKQKEEDIKKYKGTVIESIIKGKISLDVIFKNMFWEDYGVAQDFLEKANLNPHKNRKELEESSNFFKMSLWSMRKIWFYLDNIGACSYADKCNVIISWFIDKPTLFEEVFGFPLYKKDSEGNYQINVSYILLDMFIWKNSTKNGGKLFRKNGEKTEVIEQFLGKEQEYMFGVSDGNWVNSLKEYILSKTDKLEITNEVIDVMTTKVDINNLIPNLKNDLKGGKKISLSIFNIPNTSVTYANTDNGKKTLTKDWDPYDGHIVTVIDITDSEFIVDSWGGRYSISFKELNEAKNYVIDVQSINYKD